MMTVAVVKGLALGLWLSLSVGPVIFAIIKQSLNHGHKGGFAFVAGVSFSDICFVLLTNGFSSLITMALDYRSIIALVGSIFLIIMGVHTIFFKKVVLVGDTELSTLRFSHARYFKIFLSGFLMNTLNPGAFFVWFATTATIIADAAAYPHPMQYKAVVFGVCLLLVLAFDSAKVMLAGRLRPKLTYKNMLWINRLSGLILLGFGAVLLAGVLLGGPAATGH